MTLDNLLIHLRKMQEKTNEDWLATLEVRKKKELEFHNRDRDEQLKCSLSQEAYNKIYANRRFYKTVELSDNYIAKWIKENVPGKIFLDYACGNGEVARQAARNGATLAIGIDISDISIKNATEIALSENLDRITFFIQGDAEKTGLPDNCVDTIICSGVLHHLDLSYVFYELRRILKPGGKVLAIEALNYNPLIKLYRRLTPEMRTEWEKAHILSYRDLKFASRFLDVQNIRHWHLISILGRYFPIFLPYFNFLDRILLNIPLLKKMSWMFTFELIKK